jgi:hypothetical protein
MMMTMIIQLLLWTAMTWTTTTVVGFSSSSSSLPNQRDHHSIIVRDRPQSSDLLQSLSSSSLSSVLFATPNGNNHNPNQGSNSDPLDAVRNMLESSWNTEQMGQVPADPQVGAMEVYEAIMNAVDSRNVGIFYVDIILPSYDISLGEEVYDEVTAVEFCIALSQCLEGKTQILVRDLKTLTVVEKVFIARERYAESFMIDDVDDDDPDDPFGSGDDDDDDDDYDDDDDILLVQDDDQQNTLSADNDSKEIMNPLSSVEPKTEMDTFRQQLSLNWNDEDDDATTSKNYMENTPAIETTKADDDSSRSGNPGIQQKKRKKKQQQQKKKPSSLGAGKKMYRLASLFGNANFGKGGSDMADDVIRAVRLNALAEEDEENIIILSAVGSDEMIAVRGLVTKYAEEKKIILINSRFQPTPRELMSAETVYSVLPLLARGKGPSSSSPRGNSVENNSNNGQMSPKVVVMRRYPRDWQIFIDIGDGFDLAETKTVTQANKRGLSMEWIAGCVEKYLQSRR